MLSASEINFMAVLKKWETAKHRYQGKETTHNFLLKPMVFQKKILVVVLQPFDMQRSIVSLLKALTHTNR